MVVTTLKPVLKTVLVGSVKLTASADCIGSGKVAIIPNDPANFLSSEHVFVLHVPVPEHWSRQEVADMPSLLPRAEASESSPGTPSGVRACPRAFPSRFANSRSAGMRRSFPLSAMVDIVADPTGTGRLRCPGSFGDSARIDRDCQSRDYWRDFQQDYLPRLGNGSHHSLTRTMTTPSAKTAAK